MTLKEVKNGDIMIPVAFYEGPHVLKIEKCKVEKYNSTYCKVEGVKVKWETIQKKYNNNSILRLEV